MRSKRRRGRSPRRRWPGTPKTSARPLVFRTCVSAKNSIPPKCIASPTDDRRVIESCSGFASRRTSDRAAGTVRMRSPEFAELRPMLKIGAQIVLGKFIEESLFDSAPPESGSHAPVAEICAYSQYASSQGAGSRYAAMSGSERKVKSSPQGLL
jgi:hypothetical protein